MKALTTPNFLTYLGQRNIQIRTVGGRLQVNAPAGTVDASLRAELMRRKDELVQLLEGQETGRGTKPHAVSRRPERIPLTFAQERLWLIDRFQPGSATYNIPEAFVVEGSLDLDIFKWAIEEVVQRHEVLRTHIEELDNEPVQVISERASIPVGHTDLSNMDQLRAEVILKEQIRELAGLPFSLKVPPLFRVHVFTVSAAMHIVFLNVHHILADGWSLGILRREILDYYKTKLLNVESELEPLPLQYADVALWERSEDNELLLQHGVRYWKTRLAGAPTLLELPFSKPREQALSSRGSVVPVVISEKLTKALRGLGREESSSLFMTVLSIFAILLFRYTGMEDFCIGSPISGREPKETEGLIGFFVNTIVLRCNASGTPTFRQFLRQMREVAFDAFAHGSVPFQKLVSELNPDRDLARSPIFQMMFALDAFSPSTAEVIEQVDAFNGTSKFDLTLQLREHAQTISGVIEYRTDLFHSSDIEALNSHFLLLLEQIVGSPDRLITELALITEGEDALLKEWNETGAKAPAEVIHELFEKQCRVTPDAVAIIDRDVRVTYAELNRRSNKMARYVKGLIRGSEALVGICMDRSPEMLIAMMAVLKAGGAYVPLDPKYPSQRLAYIANDSGIQVLICQGQMLERFPLFSGITIPLEDAHLWGDYDDQDLLLGVKPENLAYVIYTSGSTGAPKGVGIEHHSTVSLLSWAHSCFAAELLSGMLASTSICFDLSIFEIFLPLSYGYKLILAENTLELPKLIARDEVTLINTVPSSIAALLKAGAIPKSVRAVCLAGEFLSASLVDELYSLGTIEDVFDLYGPTETTTYSTWTRRVPSAPPSIGKPIANTRIYLLDSNQMRVPIGVHGEIYIAGAGVARGYLGRDELTTERFVSPRGLQESGPLYRTGDIARFRTDGNLEYLGRKDFQVKLRGYRIELGEIEAVLCSCQGVSGAVVMILKDEAATEHLAAFVIQKSEGSVSVDGLTSLLRDRLPAYMVPQQIKVMDEFPLTPNGKVDRRVLAGHEFAKAGPVSKSRAPGSQLERQLVELWEECFKRKSIGIDDNFFEIGGHSLLAFELFSKIETSLRITLPLAVLFKAPTVAQLAEVIRKTK